MLDRSSLISESIRLIRPFWPLAAAATAMGTLSGLATAWLLATINEALYSDGGFTQAALWTFVGLVVLTLIGEIISDLGNSFIGQQVIAGLRKDLVARIIAAPIDQIERYKSHRLLSSLGQDVDTISSFSYAFSSYAIAFAVIVGCVAYLLYLSPGIFLLVAIVITVGIAVNRLARQRGRVYQNEARSAQDQLYKQYRAISEGAKELRINRDRRRRVHSSELGGTIDRVRDLRFRAFRIFMSANAVDSALYFALIGVILAGSDWFAVERTVVSGFILVLLYMRGPLNQLLRAYGSFVNAQISFERIARLSADFTNPEPHLLDEAIHAARDDEARQIESITLEAASYRFPTSDDAEPFTLGPIDLNIAAGEIIFIVGENGCGKTTLLKLLLGLYEPQSGNLLLGGEPVSPRNRDDYRQLFSAVFFDYFLFDDLVVPEEAIREKAAGYLSKLEIAHKVRIEGDRFSTTDLSAGQRKRLALIQVYLENRPIIVFDEWAAEQDPTFRRLFYTEILPDLQRQGKTLIVVSHDDRYFDVADRIIRLEAGKITETRNMPDGANNVLSRTAERADQPDAAFSPSAGTAAPEARQSGAAR